jgi:spoIIIJ-associated protein
MERTQLEVIADSVDEAVTRGLGQLGLPREKVNVEVMDPGSRGFLGIGGRQVRVKLTVLEEGEMPSSSQTASGSGMPGAATSAETASVAPSLAPARTVAGKAEGGPSGDELLDMTRETIETLLAKMKMDAAISTSYGEADEDGQTPVLVDIHGEDLSVLIGRRSETLNALQYISGLIVSKQAGHYVQLLVDVEGFRSRRERQLRQLARRMAEQAVHTGRRQVLEPMSPADRRVIHIELRDDTSVTTESIGVEPNRKVTIVPR